MALSAFDCRSCKEKTGCEKDADYPVADLDGEPLHRCPVRLVTEESLQMLKLFNICRAAGALPTGGGALQQPARLMEAFELIQEALAKHKPKGGRRG